MTETEVGILGSQPIQHQRDKEDELRKELQEARAALCNCKPDSKEEARARLRTVLREFSAVVTQNLHF